MVGRRDPREELPDVRDGLTRVERVVLHVLREAELELRGRSVPTALLHGRVVERLDISEGELQRVLARLARHERGPR